MQEVGFISPHPGGRLDASEAPGPQPACRLGLWVCLPRYNPALRTFRWVGSECPGCVRYSQQTICRCSATPSPPCEGRRTDGNTTWRYRATTQVPRSPGSSPRSCSSAGAAGLAAGEVLVDCLFELDPACHDYASPSRAARAASSAAMRPASYSEASKMSTYSHSARTRAMAASASRCISATIWY